MNKISSWLPHYVMTIVIFMLIASFFETICLLISTLLLGNNEDNNYKVYVAIGKTKGETKKEISFPDDFDIEVENEKLRLELLKYFEE